MNFYKFLKTSPTNSGLGALSIGPNVVNGFHFSLEPCNTGINGNKKLKI